MYESIFQDPKDVTDRQISLEDAFFRMFRVGQTEFR